jgi:dTMP kinase
MGDEKHRGTFIALDGPDGSGKTTQARRLSAFLSHKLGREPLLVREPGGTDVGEKIRDILLDRANTSMGVECELLLYMASRAQLMREVLLPALQGGEVVLADRFLPASVVYQGLAGGLPIDAVLDIGWFATGGIAPDVTLLYDVPPAVGQARCGGSPDRMEAKDGDFHERVRQGYLQLPEILPWDVRILDGSRPAGEVEVESREIVLEVMGL